MIILPPPLPPPPAPPAANPFPAPPLDPLLETVPFIFKLPIGFNQNSTDEFISYKNIFSDKLYDNFIISYLLILDYNIN